MSYGFKIIVEGDYALFSRPELKVERVSYDVPPPGALEGLLKSVYWKPAILSVRPIRSSRSFPNCRRGRLCRISSMGRRISWTRKGGRWDCDVSGLRGSFRGRVSGWECWFAISRSYRNVRLPRYMICSIAILPISTGVSVA